MELHRNVQSVKYRDTLQHDGILDTTMIVEVGIPLQKNSLGFYQQDVEGLVEWATAQMKLKGYRVEFWSVTDI